MHLTLRMGRSNEEEAQVIGEEEPWEGLLRDKSLHHHLLKKIRKEENELANQIDDAMFYQNYSPKVLAVFENTCIPYTGLFCRGGVQKSKDKKGQNLDFKRTMSY